MSASPGPTSAVGVDVIEIERVEAALARFGERVLRGVETAEGGGVCRGGGPELAGGLAGKVDRDPSRARAAGVGMSDELTLEELSARTGEPTEGLRRWRELGLIGSAEGDGVGPEGEARGGGGQAGGG